MSRRIAILSPAHPLRGGIAASSERLAMQLQQEGHEVVLISFSLQYPAILFPGKTQYTSDAAPDGLLIRTMVNSVNPLNWLRVGRWLAAQRFDALLVRYWLPFMAPCLGSIMQLTRRNCHTRVIALVDNLVPHEHRPGDRLLTRWFTGAADAFIVMSRTVEQQLHEFAPGKPVAFVPHPVYDNYGLPAGKDESLQRLGLPPAHGYVLFFGFIRDYKGLDLLLQAMARPEVAELNLHLIVAGEFYGNEAKYRSLIAELELENQLSLFDRYIPVEEVRYYFGAADLVAQPYRSATQSGISQLAYHFEKPMLVTDVGGLPEIVTHGQSGYVVAPEAAGIAAAIRDFFAAQRASAMTEAVRQEKHRFSWEAMTKALIALL